MVEVVEVVEVVDARVVTLLDDDPGVVSDVSLPVVAGPLVPAPSPGTQAPPRFPELPGA